MKFVEMLIDESKKGESKDKQKPADLEDARDSLKNVPAWKLRILYRLVELMEEHNCSVEDLPKIMANIKLKDLEPKKKRISDKEKIKLYEELHDSIINRVGELAKEMEREMERIKNL